MTCPRCGYTCHNRCSYYQSPTRLDLAEREVTSWEREVERFREELRHSEERLAKARKKVEAIANEPVDDWPAETYLISESEGGHPKFFFKDAAGTWQTPNGSYGNVTITWEHLLTMTEGRTLYQVESMKKQP